MKRHIYVCQFRSVPTSMGSLRTFVKNNFDHRLRKVVGKCARI